MLQNEQKTLVGLKNKITTELALPPIDLQLSDEMVAIINKIQQPVQFYKVEADFVELAKNALNEHSFSKY